METKFITQGTCGSNHCTNIQMFFSLQVSEDEKVSTVKELVSERLNIPANQQRLLYKGKALAGKIASFTFSITPLHDWNWLSNQFILQRGQFLQIYRLHSILLSSDEHRLSDYSIGPEAKLNLVIRPVGERSGASGMVASSSGSSSNSQERVWQTVSTILSRHFSPADAAKVHEQLIKVCDSQYLQPCIVFI